MALKKCWLVETPSQGDALFLEESRAAEYVSKHGGIIVSMYGQTSNLCKGSRQTRQGANVCPEQLQQNPSVAEEICNASWPIAENLSTC